jgi:hypothetical protein
VCLSVVLGAVTLPWFVHALDIDLWRVAATVFAYVLIHLAFSTATERLESSAAVTAALRTMLFAGVAFLTLLWHLVGGLENPIFLAAFTLPVIMSGLMMTGAQTLLTALVSVLLVTGTALVESPDLRWYAAQLHMVRLSKAAALAAEHIPRVDAVTGFDASATYQFTLLVMFAAIQMTVAFLSRPLAVLLVRVNSRLEVSSKMLTEVQGACRHRVCRYRPVDPGHRQLLQADAHQAERGHRTRTARGRPVRRPAQRHGRLRGSERGAAVLRLPGGRRDAGGERVLPSH